MQVELFAGVMTFLYMTYRWENFDIKLHSLRTKNIKKYQKILSFCVISWYYKRKSWDTNKPGYQFVVYKKRR